MLPLPLTAQSCLPVPEDAWTSQVARFEIEKNSSGMEEVGKEVGKEK